MKAVLTFDLSDPEDALEYKRCNAARDALGALWDIQEWLREQEKYHERDCHETRTALADMLELHGIDLGELWA